MHTKSLKEILAAALFIFHFLESHASTLEECTGKKVKYVKIEGCEGAKCADNEEYGKFLSLTDIEPGEVYSAEKVKKAKLRFEKTGFFKSVEARCVMGEDGAVVVFSVSSNMFIRGIGIYGNKHFYKSDIKKRVFLTAGDVFNPGTEEGKELLKRQEESIKRLYLDEGLKGTVVKVVPEVTGKNSVMIKIHISEGEREKIREIKASIAWAKVPLFKGFVAPEEKYEVKCPELHERDLRSFSGISIGESFTEKTFAVVKKNLASRLKGIGFKNPVVTSKFTHETGRLEINVKHDGCHLIRFLIREEWREDESNFREFSDEELLKLLPFKDSGVFDFEESEIAREEISIYFENKGFLFADVKLDFRTFSAKDYEIIHPAVKGAITFLITLNQKIEIRKIIFKGNKEISDQQLEEIMETKPYDFFGEGGFLLIDQMLWDLEKIKRYYHSRGFYDFKFPLAKNLPYKIRTMEQDGKNALFTYSFEDKAFVVRKLPLQNAIYVEIPIEEGVQTELVSLEVTGNSAVSTKEIIEAAKLKAGGYFSAELLKKAYEEIRRIYLIKGYYMVKISFSCLNAAGGGSNLCEGGKFGDFSIKKVRLRINIEDGERITIGEIFLHGNERTSASTIIQDFPKPGEPYDLEKIAEAERRLRNLGIFESIHVTAIGLDEKPVRKKVALLVELRETESRFIDFSAGFESLNRPGKEFPKYLTSLLATTISISDTYGAGWGRVLGLQIPDLLLVSEIEYTDNNFFSRAKSLFLPLKYGFSTTSWHRLATFSPTYMDSRFFYTGLTFRLTPFVTYDRATTTLDLFKFGGEISVSKKLLSHLFGTLSYEISKVKTKKPYEEEYSPFRLENKVMPFLQYDRLDHPINPTKGIFASSLLSYINAVEQEVSKNFIKYELTAKLFFSVKKKLIFGTYFHFGNSKSFEASRLPDEERFTLGGNKGMRGFSDDGISQYNPDGSIRLSYDSETKKWGMPYGGDTVFNGSFEVRFPIISKIGLWGGSFLDYGALAERLSEISPKSVRMSLGFGLRWLLGDQIPFRLDYGIILDRRCKEVSFDSDPSKVKCLLNEELGNIHFGILYTF